MAWYDREGRKLETVGEPATYRGIALSHDGRFVAVHRHDQPLGGDIWVLDLERGGVSTRRTFGTGDNSNPVWSPDDTQLLYTGASFNLYRTNAAGAGAEEVVLDSLRFAFASDWSSDGPRVLISYVPPTANNPDIAALTLNADRPVEPILATGFDEGAGKISPDGRWIAYHSNESGRYEVYVRPFPVATRQTQVSTAGGVAPRWSPDGRELFYLTDDATLMAVAVRTGDGAIETEAPRALFKADLVIGDHTTIIGQLHHYAYDVSPDGQRFLINERIDDAPAESGAPSEPAIAVVVGWPAKLEK